MWPGVVKQPRLRGGPGGPHEGRGGWLLCSCRPAPGGGASFALRTRDECGIAVRGCAPICTESEGGGAQSDKGSGPACVGRTHTQLHAHSHAPPPRAAPAVPPAARSLERLRQPCLGALTGLRPVECARLRENLSPGLATFTQTGAAGPVGRVWGGGGNGVSNPAHTAAALSLGPSACKKSSAAACSIRSYSV